jgi:hypothetical protein
MTRRTLGTMASLALALLAPAALSAQEQAPGEPPAVTVAATAAGDQHQYAGEELGGPRVEAATVGVRAAAAAGAVAVAAPPQARRSLGQARAMMIVGGATFLAGALIGGDAGTIIMVAGAGIGLWGLYQYLR